MATAMQTDSRPISTKYLHRYEPEQQEQQQEPEQQEQQQQRQYKYQLFWSLGLHKRN
jgi:hypothetical protein